MDDFVNLHNHSDHSLLDGAQSIKGMVERSGEIGQGAIALTDHGQLFGTYTFQEECNKNGVKPIIGFEAYVAPGDHKDKSRVHWGDGAPETKRSDLSGGGSYTHLTLLAKGSRGVRNLFKLSSFGFTEGFYSKPRVSLELLGSLQEDLIVLSGCLSGELLTRLALGQEDEADAYVRRMKDVFGQNFYIEIMDHGFEAESRHTPSLLSLARRYGVRAVATNDSHYTRKDDNLLHDAMLCLGTNAKLSDETRMRFDGNGYYVKSRAEMEGLQLPESALDNTLYIAEQIGDCSDAFGHVQRMPSSGNEDPARELRRLVELGLLSRGLNYDQCGDSRYEQRAYDELQIIEGADFPDYFVVMEDLVSWARSQGIWVGPGRGSAGGSLVSYALGLTGLDPIEDGLVFERFLNPERIAPPDIDVDFQASRRDEVIGYAISKYGEDRVARIITIGTIGAKNGLKDAARVLGRPHEVGTRLTWSLPKPRAGRMPSLSEADMSKVEDLEVFDLASRLEGLARTSGVHASGLVISPVPIIDVLPIFIPPKKQGSIPATQFNHKDVEKLGLVKLDPLGLQMGDVIESALRMSGGRLPETRNDPATFELLRTGETRAVFQLDSPGMRSLLKRLGPRDFSDIAAVLALYRPGPMGVNAHLEYADRRNGREMVSYPHPEFASALEGTLGPTFGVIVYQEQVMSSLRTICGYSLAQADLVRKAMGKKDRELLAAEFDQFYRKGRENGYSDESLRALWDTLVPFADYGFNKAHAYGYAVLAYWTAYLKCHYPEAYMAAVLTFEGSGKKAEDEESKQTEFVSEASRMGIAILPPSVNGGLTWTPDGSGGIYYGLTSIKGVGGAAALPIVGNAPYNSWQDYLRRAPKIGLNSGTVRALASSGAFDVLGGREAIRAVSEGQIAQAIQEREELKRGEVGFGRRSFELPEVPPDWEARKRDERAFIGAELSAQALLLRAPDGLDENHWEYVRRTLRDRPGASVCRVRYGSWELRADTKVDREGVLQSLYGLGFVEETQ